MILPARPIYRIEDVEVDPDLYCVRRNGQEQHLRPQVFQVLLYLLDHRQRLVTKEELIESVWQGAAVTDDALVQCIVDLRKALGDDPRQPRFIKSIPKTGYCFIADVEETRPKLSTALEFGETTLVEVEVEEELDGNQPEQLSDSVAGRQTFLSAQPARQLLRRDGTAG